MNRKKLFNAVACLALTAASVLTTSSLAGCDEASAVYDVVAASDPGSQTALNPGGDGHVALEPGTDGLVALVRGVFGLFGATPINIP